MTANQIILEAIAHKKCIRVTYNRVEMLLAPHILYTKNDAYYLDAVAMERSGAAVRDKKIGSYHLSGLSDVALADRYFQPESLFDPASEKYAGVTLFAV